MITLFLSPPNITTDVYCGQGFKTNGDKYVCMDDGRWTMAHAIVVAIPQLV
jgi:hypothetical protein